MNVLICYASTEGQTRKIARFCASQLIAKGHSVEVIAAADAEELSLELFDAAVLAGSVHVGNIQPELTEFARAHASGLNAQPTLYLQVSLAVVSGDEVEQSALEEIAADLCNETGWTPGAIHQVAGAFRFSQYDFFRSWAMRWLASRSGKDVDPHRDTEFTDWEALSALFADWP